MVLDTSFFKYLDTSSAIIIARFRIICNHFFSIIFAEIRTDLFVSEFLSPPILYRLRIIRILYIEPEPKLSEVANVGISDEFKKNTVSQNSSKRIEPENKIDVRAKLAETAGVSTDTTKLNLDRKKKGTTYYIISNSLIYHLFIITVISVLISLISAWIVSSFSA